MNNFLVINLAALMFHFSFSRSKSNLSVSKFLFFLTVFLEKEFFLDMLMVPLSDTFLMMREQVYHK